jgi:hypothetical protein
MIKKIIGYVAENNSNDMKLYELIKVIKAKSTNLDIIDGLKSMETSIAVSIKRNKVLLNTLKDGLEDYTQQFASEFNLLYEVINDKFLILSKVKGGYQVLLTTKDGGVIASKTYTKQVDAIEYFIELYKTE